MKFAFLIGILNVVNAEKKLNVTVLECDSSQRGYDDAYEEIKYLGTPKWPKPLVFPFSCEWEIEVNKYERGNYLKISFIDFNTDCSKRNRLILKEGGRIKVEKVCGKREITDFIARSGRVTIKMDFGDGPTSLISYNSIPPTEPEGSFMPDGIPRLKMSGRASPASSYEPYNDYGANNYDSSRSYDYDHYNPVPTYKIPHRRPTTKRVQIKYTPPNIKPTKAVIKIAHQQPDLPEDDELSHAEREALGLRNILLTVIFGALGVIILCAIIYLSRRFLLQVENDRKAELEEERRQKEAQENILSQAKERYESQSNKIKASYTDRKL